MSTALRDHFNYRKTPQTEVIPGREKEMAQNNAGGVSFLVDDWTRLDRFLILGSEGGTYYVSERRLTIDNAKAVVRCIDKDGIRAVNRIVEISDSGRAAKNDPALFALAIAAAAKDAAVRQAALEALPKVARIGTHLFHFAHFVEGFRGWGRALRKAIANWYIEMPVEKLALQAIKYQSRDGWSHRDLLRLAHPKTEDAARDAVFRWISGGTDALSATTRQAYTSQGYVDTIVAPRNNDLPRIIRGFEKMKALDSNDVAGAVKLIQKYDLPREAVKTEFLNDAHVWEALLEKMPLNAMLRNLNKMTSVGLLAPFSDATTKVVNTLTNSDALKRARVHPFNVLVALETYRRGHGFRGGLSWSPVDSIVDALDDAFYASFGNVEPTGKNTLIAVDCSGSMLAPVLGNEMISCRTAAAALALVTANVESNYEIIGFSNGTGFSASSGRHGWFASGLKELKISPRIRLDTVVDRMARFNWGGTDCALPALYVKQNKLPVDSILTITDSETWAGNIQPTQALAEARKATGRNIRQAVVGMTASNFSIADPKDSGQMDFCGFDSNGPQLLSEFFRGNI